MVSRDRHIHHDLLVTGRYRLDVRIEKLAVSAAGVGSHDHCHCSLHPDQFERNESVSRSKLPMVFLVLAEVFDAINSSKHEKEKI